MGNFRYVSAGMDELKEWGDESFKDYKNCSLVYSYFYADINSFETFGRIKWGREIPEGHVK